MSHRDISRFISPAIRIVAAGFGASVAGPLGGALGGVLGGAFGEALGKPVADLIQHSAEKFGDESAKKLLDTGVESLVERLKGAALDLPALCREALRLCLAEIQPHAEEGSEDWFEHWNACLRASVPLRLDEIQPDQIALDQLDAIFYRTLQRLDGQGTLILQKSPSINLPTRPVPDELLAELKSRLPEYFKEAFDTLIVQPEYEQAWKEVQRQFQKSISKQIGRIKDDTKRLLIGMEAIQETLGISSTCGGLQLGIEFGKRKIPYEIPSPVGDFTNRTEDLKKLRPIGSQSRAIVILGEPGLGKTEIAKQFAAEIGSQYQDGHIYFDLKGESASPVRPHDLLSDLIQKFDPSAAGTVDLEQMGKRCRSVLYGKRVLLFLDNVASVEQVRQVEAPQEGLLLITAHKKFYIPGALAAELNPFNQTDSESLLLRISPRIGEYAAAIAKLCCGVPFALRKAAETLLSRPDKKPRNYVNELMNSQKHRSDLVEAVIGTSFDLLGSVEIQQQWCGLSCFVDPFSREALEAVWNLPPDDADRSIESLLNSTLLHYDVQRERYYLYDLDRAFAQVYLKSDQPYPRCHAKYFIGQLLSHRHPLELLDPIANEVFAAHAYCEQERHRRSSGSLIDIVGEILASNKITAAKTVYLIARLFKRRHRFEEAMPLYEACYQAAMELGGNASLEGACLRSIGEIDWILGNQPEAKKFCDLAVAKLKSSSEAGNDNDSRKELIFTLHLNSERFLRSGTLQEAEEAASTSMQVRDQILPKHRDPETGVSNGVIKLIAFLLARGELKAAKKLFDSERVNLEGLSLGSTLGQLGCALRDAGDWPEAELCFEAALNAYKENWVGIGWIHRCFAELELRRDDLKKARQHIEQAVNICSEIDAKASQAALTSIVAIQFFYRENVPERIETAPARLGELFKQIDESDISLKRKAAPAFARLEKTLLACGRLQEAESLGKERARIEASIHEEEEPSSDVESLADRWGCDAIAMAWPGQLLRLLSPRRITAANQQKGN